MTHQLKGWNHTEQARQSCSKQRQSDLGAVRCEQLHEVALTDGARQHA